MGYESTARPINDEITEQVRTLLRKARFAGFDRNIVAAGFVRDIAVTARGVVIGFAPNTRDQAKIKQMEKDIHDVLGTAGFTTVEIKLSRPFSDADVLSSGGQTPPREPMAETSGIDEHDVIDPAMQRPDMARQAGYDEDGPQPLAGPSSDKYEGELPVFQWEIDPQNSSANSDTANLTIDGWDFRVWWQVHPSRLVYASIQAMKSDWVNHEGAARSHPVGRSEAVNIVYDQDRKAIVAIYGTVRDFRPFVDAFHRGYILKK